MIEHKAKKNDNERGGESVLFTSQSGTCDILIELVEERLSDSCSDEEDEWM